MGLGIGGVLSQPDPVGPADWAPIRDAAQVPEEGGSEGADDVLSQVERECSVGPRRTRSVSEPAHEGPPRLDTAFRYPRTSCALEPRAR